MKVNFRLYIIGLLMTSISFAETTPNGEVATYTNSKGSFTYYDKNGDAIPTGANIVLDLDGKTANILNEKGELVAQGYATKALASNWKEQNVMATEEVSDADGNKIIFNEAQYEKSSFELTGLLFGATEVGSKFCKAAGSEMPKSLANWFEAVNSYKKGESSRDKILNERVKILNTQMQNIISNQSKKDLQLEAIQIQLEILNVTIDSIAGTNLFMGDVANNAEASKTGRLPLREKLSLSALKSLMLNSDEDLLFLEVYKNRLMVGGFKYSIQQAEDACKQTKKESKCEDKAKVETCKEEETSDAVAGCKEAFAQIPVIESTAAKEYMDLYLLPQVPSKELNEKMARLELKMKTLISAIPRSKNPKYDWHSPIESGLLEMIRTRQSSGTLCPSTIADKDYERNEKLKSIAHEGPSVEILGANKISENASAFLANMGIIGDAAVEARDVFVKTWNLTDLIIGQSGKRSEYFSEMEKKINELIDMDRAKLADLVVQHKKMSSYLNSVKSSYNPIPVVAVTNKPVLPAEAVPASSTGVKNAINKESKVEGSTSFSAVSENINANQEIIYAQLAPYEFKKLSKITSNSKAGASAGGNSAAVSVTFGTLTGESLAVSKKYTDKIKKNEQKASSVNPSTDKKSTKGSGTTASSTSKKDLTIPEKIFSNSIAKSFDKLNESTAAPELYKQMTSSGIKSDAQALPGEVKEQSAVAKAQEKIASILKEVEKKKVVEEKKAKIEKKRLLKALKSNVQKTQVYNAATGVFEEVSVAPAIEKAEVTEVESASIKEPNEDERIVDESIAAKKLKRKDAYDAAESDSLFERVTKAYIRSYEKVTKMPE